MILCFDYIKELLASRCFASVIRRSNLHRKFTQIFSSCSHKK